MAENVLYADLNLPEPTRARILTVPDVQGKSHCSRTGADAMVAVLVVIILLVVIALYLTLTKGPTAGRQQDSTTLTSSSQNVSTSLSHTSQEDSTKLPPSREEAPGKSCCSTTRVAVLVTEIILLLLIVLCQMLQYGPTAGSQNGSTTLSHIPEEALGCAPPWKKHGRRCNFFFPETTKEDWNASHAECTAMGSDLVVIDSREELSYLLSQSGSNYYFLGLTYSPEEQKWKWINNVEHDPAMFSLKEHHHDYLCTAIGFGEVHTAPCGGSSATQNMCEKASTISKRHQKES